MTATECVIAALSAPFIKPVATIIRIIVVQPVLPCRVNGPAYPVDLPARLVHAFGLGDFNHRVDATETELVFGKFRPVFINTKFDGRIADPVQFDQEIAEEIFVISAKHELALLICLIARLSHKNFEKKFTSCRAPKLAFSIIEKTHKFGHKTRTHGGHSFETDGDPLFPRRQSSNFPAGE